MKLAFIGLGVMGYPMAGYLQKAGHDVTVYNRTTAKAEKWVSDFGGSFAPTPAEAAEGADIVFACVGNDDDLRQVTIGDDGAFNTMGSHSIFVDHTTTSADVARELYDVAKDKGFNFLDAPISGGQAGAEGGILTIMVGGDADIYAKVEPVMQAYYKKCEHMGAQGAGQQTKMVNQICIAGAVQGLSEGLHLAQRAGLDVEKAISVMQNGSANSWFMENRANTMNKGEFNFGFAVDWLIKDLNIAIDESRKNGATLPTTSIISQFLVDVQRAGNGRWDVSSLITRFPK